MKRTSGLLLHLTSLPSRFGVGDLGPEAERFAAFLARAGQRQWQILPLAPSSSFVGDSPYAGFSAFGGEPLLISPELLREEGLLDASELDKAAAAPGRSVNYALARAAKNDLLRRAFARAEHGLLDDADFNGFLAANGHWANDLALFLACKEHHAQAAWYDWPAPLRDRRDEALREYGEKLAREILFHKFCQHRFFRQWGRLRARLAEHGVELVGDVPIYVTHDSPDVWCNRALFKLDAEGRRTCVAGVPPDYFSKTGQRWGNPVFDWDANQAQDFAWWTARLLHHFGLHDQVRLDHFRGFAAYWEIPAEERTAVRGRWVPAPGSALLRTLRKRTGNPARLPILAENLGIITPDVEELRREFDLPGMHVLQFGFSPGAARTPNAPFRHEPLGAVYTGTHDNNTTRGWFEQELDAQGKKRLERFVGSRVSAADAPAALLRLALASPAAQALVPAQDVLGLGPEARMNVPGLAEGNWSWRLLPGELHPSDEAALADRLAEETIFYGRTGEDLELGEYSPRHD
ncbi:4-alpha-glucanotransferase [Paucidesulfovibrio longus]|uniref:4-alpha-glucanotransferase n=1 Tax=Paucidesulfovibrio longus TaxID=889 RepID=UPI0003B78C1C|nr:4-alpha-glucanotransferase [Paucidesulfovibrio longus]